MRCTARIGNSIDLIRRAWAADEPFAFDGKYNQLRWVNCWPKPIQKPHPPIYIPGGGTPATSENPIPDIFALLPYERPRVLADAVLGFPAHA